jgi:poly-beta-1,6-N-acetyl-D-glucosamine synthase
MISIILTAWNEEGTAGTAARKLIISARKLDQPAELILVCPDPGTHNAVAEVVREEEFENFIYVQDPRKGKPHALNIAKTRVRGEIIVSTDGDVRIDENALPEIIAPFSDDPVGGVTGRPVSSNDRSTTWGYWGHMFMDAAHKRRMETLGKGGFFVMSGYLLAVRADIPWEIPDGVLDDIYLTYAVHNEGYKIAYAPEARVYVRQPTNMRDWLTQKVRSLSGHYDMQRHFGDVPETRSFRGEFSYFFFPLSYARNVRELVWGFIQYPVRIYTWIRVFWTVRVRKLRAADVWGRTESTKEVSAE